MKIKNAKRWAMPGPLPYALALLGMVVAFALRVLLHGVLDEHMAFWFFSINSIVIAFFFGFLPSAFSILLSLPLAFFYFVKPYQSFDGIQSEDIYKLVVYLSSCLIAAVMLEWLRREQYQSSLLARMADCRFRLMVEADEDRRQAIKRAAAARDLEPAEPAQ